ncbi:hypothetical protein [uncultured Capnocytophaga sp.]|uniref:hypothetical protein n=1 Tax=uncultured Capnocytophaga sp. TaxID=159273 RepID=UPI00262274D8|nr:hypothetical protein [uncultured Capnocytophaga sp.]
MEEDIRSDIEEFLENTKEPFYNECEFQMYLALFLKEKGYNIYLEYSVPLDCEKVQGEINKRKKRGESIPFSNREKMDIDIVIEKDNFFYPIELKYKTRSIQIDLKRFGEDLKDSKFLKDQGAIPIGRYDFWKDVARLEFIKESFKQKICKGFCVFLTNEKKYKEEEIKTSEMFTMEKGKPHKGLLCFKTPSLAKKYKEFSLLENHQIEEWKELSSIGFHYCIVEV